MTSVVRRLLFRRTSAPNPAPAPPRPPRERHPFAKFVDDEYEAWREDSAAPEWSFGDWLSHAIRSDEAAPGLVRELLGDRLSGDA